MNVRHSFYCFALAVAAAASARAAELTWDAPAGCPDREALRWRIEEALGMTLGQAAPLNFSGKVEQKSVNRWVVGLDVTSDSNQTEAQHREFEAPSCDELAQAVSVVIALALGADRSEPEPSPAERPTPAESPPQPEPKSNVVTPLARAAAAQNKSETKLGYWLAAELGPEFDIGSLPGLAPGIQGSATAGKGAVGVKLAAVAFPNDEKAGSPGGTFTLLAASVSICGVSPHTSTIVRLCAGSEFGRLSGKGEHTTSSWTGASAWVAPGLELTGSWPLFGESLRLFGSGALAIPLIRRQFQVEHPDTAIHRPGTVIGRLGAGLEWLWQ